jgi:hypothetical protein
MLLHPALAKAHAVHAFDRADPQLDENVEIRLAWASDAPGLVKLAQLDSALAAAAELPARAAAGDVLVATVEGKLVAALSIRDGLLVSDPFRRTGTLLALLELRRRQLGRAERRHRLSLPMLRPRHS